MMTSTFWPDAAPPLPPPPPVSPDAEAVARPPTTPATTATRAIAATRDREKTVRVRAIAFHLVVWACLSCHLFVRGSLDTPGILFPRRSRERAERNVDLHKPESVRCTDSSRCRW